MSYRFLVASYTESIVTLELKLPTEGPAELSIVASQKVGFHPSWIAQSKTNPGIYYTGLEQEDGRLLTLEYDRSTGQGKIVGDVSSGGHSPCSILVVDGDVLVGNYMSGTLAVFAPDGDGKLVARQPAIQFSGSGPNADRQESSHPHQAYAIPRDGHYEVLVPDLGADHIWRLEKNAAGVWEVRGSVRFDENVGGGPRHVVFHENVLYTILELTNELTAHTLPPLPSSATGTTSDHPSTPQLLACSSTLRLPPGSGPVSMLAAELLLAPSSSSFPDTYLYASNRNDPHPEGDTIAIFKPLMTPSRTRSVDGEGASSQLQLVGEVRTGLAHLRGMILFGRDDRYLIAGGALGGGVKVFERVDGGVSLRQITSLPSSVEELKATGFASL